MTYSAKINHCNLPITSLASCEKLKEIPTTCGGVVSLCSKEPDEECCYAVEIEHKFPGLPIRQET